MAAWIQVAVVAQQAMAGERPMVVATHGMMMTTWLVSIGAVVSGRAGDFCTDLRRILSHRV